MGGGGGRGGFKALLQLANFTLGPDATLNTEIHKNSVLIKDELRLSQKEVSYMLHVISSDGFKADRNRIDALIIMPLPTDKHGVQRYLGMVNYLQNLLHACQI